MQSSAVVMLQFYVRSPHPPPDKGRAVEPKKQKSKNMRGKILPPHFPRCHESFLLDPRGLNGALARRTRPRRHRLQINGIHGKRRDNRNHCETLKIKVTFLHKFQHWHPHFCSSHLFLTVSLTPFLTADGTVCDVCVGVLRSIVIDPPSRDQLNAKWSLILAHRNSLERFRGPLSLKMR